MFMFLRLLYCIILFSTILLVRIYNLAYQHLIILASCPLRDATWMHLTSAFSICFWVPMGINLEKGAVCFKLDKPA